MGKTPNPAECPINGCGVPRAPGSTWCAAHLAQFQALGKHGPNDAPVRVPAYLPTQRPTTPATAPTAPLAKETPVSTIEITCIEPGCNEPILVGPSGRQYNRCRQHHGAAVSAGRGRSKATPATAPTPAQDAAVDRVAASFGDVVPEPEPPPAPRPIPAAVAPEPVAQAIAPASPVAAVLEAATGGMASPLRQLILDALNDGDDVQFSVSGIEIQFTGKIRL